MKKQLQLFLLPEDENEVSRRLEALRPALQFLDDNVWPEGVPRSVGSIDACRTPFAYLWDQAIVAELPTMKRKDGQTEGPVIGVVIQVVRSRLEGDFLLSGRVAAGTDGLDASVKTPVERFAADVWKVVAAVTMNRLEAIDPKSGKVLRSEVKEYRAGLRATTWISSVSGRYFKDRSTQNFFRPRVLG